jgi:hypothetical protein
MHDVALDYPTRHMEKYLVDYIDVAWIEFSQIDARETVNG